MLDIKFLRENPELVKENIKKKFQDAKLPLVDEVIDLDRRNRAAIQEASDLRAKRTALSKANGPLFGKLKKAEGAERDAIQAQIDANMAEVKADDERLAALEVQEGQLAEEIRHRMLLIPNIIDPLSPSARTTAATWRSSASASRWCRTSRSPTTRPSWSASTASIWTRRGA